MKLGKSGSIVATPTHYSGVGVLLAVGVAVLVAEGVGVLVLVGVIVIVSVGVFVSLFHVTKHVDSLRLCSKFPRVGDNLVRGIAPTNQIESSLIPVYLN